MNVLFLEVLRDLSADRWWPVALFINFGCLAMQSLCSFLFLNNFIYMSAALGVLSSSFTTEYGGGL